MINDADVREIISKYMAVTLSRATLRFVNTKKDNLLKGTVDIDHYRESIHLSSKLYPSQDLIQIKSLSDIQFVFENEYLIDAVFSLSSREQFIIYCKYFLGMTDREIAEKMHITRHSVTRRKLNILHKLRESLEGTKQMWR